MFDLPPARRRTVTRQVSLSACVPLDLMELIDDLTDIVGTNRSRLVAQALMIGLPLLEAQLKANWEAAAADQQPTVKE